MRTTFLPALTSQDAPDDCLRDLFGLPCHAGGVGIPNPCVMSKNQFSNSLSVTVPLVELLINQSDSMPMEVLVAQGHIKWRVHVANHRAIYDRSIVICANLPPPLQNLFDIANEKGSSTWLSVIPLRSHGYHLYKEAFRDGLCLRYGWDPSRLPEACVCGVPFSVNHALNCPCGGLPSLRHNNLRDITTSLFKEVCHNVITEPVLHPLSGETLHPRSAITDDNAQSDIKVDGFWGCRQQSSFFDIKIFNPTASTYLTKSL